MNTVVLLWCGLLAAVGFGFVIYGRKHRAVMPVFCGLVMLFTNAMIFIVSAVGMDVLSFLGRG